MIDVQVHDSNHIIMRLSSRHTVVFINIQTGYYCGGGDIKLERLKDKTAEFTLPPMCPLFRGSTVQDVGGMRNAWLL